MKQGNPIAVLTGDLVNSRRADTSAVGITFDALRAATDDFGQAHQLDLRFTRFRGDGWQAVLTRPNTILEATLFILARLKATPNSLATRIGIGIGPSTSLGTSDLADADGPAFITSGRVIDSMSPKRRLPIAGQGIGQNQTAILDLTEFITAGWTTTQAQAMAHALRNYPRTQDDIASELGITRQAVQSRLAGAGLAYFETSIGAFRHHSFKTPPQD